MRMDAPNELVLSISDEEVCNVLGTLNLECPSYLGQTPSTRAGFPMSDSIRMSQLMNSIMSYEAPEQNDGDVLNNDGDVFTRIQSVLRWSLDWWEERQRQEDDAKRQRFKISPSDLEKGERSEVVSYGIGVRWSR